MIGLGFNLNNNNPPSAALTRTEGLGRPGFVARVTPTSTPSLSRGGVVFLLRLLRSIAAGHSPRCPLAAWLAGAFRVVALAAAHRCNTCPASPCSGASRVFF